MQESSQILRRAGGRPAAGTDPQKRSQIIEGAARLFTSLGFDATSMSDVAREADVSKATLYVYFPDKEQLFTRVCAERRDRSIAELISLLDTERPLENVLHDFAHCLLARLSEPFVISAHRVVIGVVERMPDVGKEFFDAGPQRLAQVLAGLLRHHVAAGTLKIDDCYLAAVQFLELVQASVFRPRLYGVITEPISVDDAESVISSALRMFLAAYAVS